MCFLDINNMSMLLVISSHGCFSYKRMNDLSFHQTLLVAQAVTRLRINPAYAWSAAVLQSQYQVELKILNFSSQDSSDLGEKGSLPGSL